MDTAYKDPVRMVLTCHPIDYASMAAAAAAVGMKAEDFCKLAIHLVVSLDLMSTLTR